MTIARIIVSCGYAALMLFAVIMQHKQTKRWDIPMAAGAIALIIANFAVYNLVTAIAALVLMHAAALLNGRFAGKINPLHHVVRLAVSAGIIVLFVLS